MVKKNLKIAIFHLAFFYSGGGEKLVLEEIKGLKKRGHHVDCFTPTLNRKLCYPDIIKKYRIQVLFPFLSNLFFHHESMEIVFSCLLSPFIAGRFKDYDVILGANQPGPWFGWIIKQITGVPYLIYLAQPTRILYPRHIDKITGVWVKQKVPIFSLLVKIFKPFIRWVDKISICGANRVLVNGEYMSKVISKVYGLDVISCPAGAYPINNPVEKRWEGEIRINGLMIQKPYILISNRHFPQKKFEYVIYGMPEIMNKVHNILLVISGNPTNYTNRLKQLTEKLKISDKVIFTGYIKENFMPSLYANAAVYAYTAPEEDFGMGVIESMAAGVPVVAWNKGGPSKTINNQKTGLLIKPYLEKEFSKALINMVSNTNVNRKMGKNAKERVQKYFTYKNHLNILERELFKIHEKRQI